MFVWINKKQSLLVYLSSHRVSEFCAVNDRKEGIHCWLIILQIIRCWEWERRVMSSETSKRKVRLSSAASRWRYIITKVYEFKAIILSYTAVISRFYAVYIFKTKENYLFVFLYLNINQFKIIVSFVKLINVPLCYPTYWLSPAAQKQLHRRNPSKCCWGMAKGDIASRNNKKMK